MPDFPAKSIYTVIIADDHPLTLLGTQQFISTLYLKVIEMCTNGQTALEAIQNHSPDLAILDIDMPILSGLEILETLYNRKSKTKVVILTMHNDSVIFQKCSQFGAVGFVLKDQAQVELPACLQSIQNGFFYTSPHLNLKSTTSILQEPHSRSHTISVNLIEEKIIQLVAQNIPSREIAKLLYISEKSVEKHRARIAEKLNLPKERNALLTWAIQNKDNLPIANSHD